MKHHKIAPRKRSPKDLPRFESWELWSYRLVGFLSFVYEAVRGIIHK